MIQLGTNDILSGKGKKIGSHSGNEQFRAIIVKHVKDYHAANSNVSKRNIVCKVHLEVKNLSPPGRFLAERKGHYFEQSDNEVEKKIKMAIRDRLKVIRKGLDTSTKNGVQVPVPKVCFQDPKLSNHIGNDDLPYDHDSFLGYIAGLLNSQNLSLNSQDLSFSCMSTSTISQGNIIKMVDENSKMSISTMDGLPYNPNNAVQHKIPKILPRHREILEREREVKRDATTLEKNGLMVPHFWPQFISIENDIPTMLPDDTGLNGFEGMNMAQCSVSSF